MRFNVSWLTEYLETSLSAAQLAERLTAIGLEVEGVYSGRKLVDQLAAEGVAPELAAQLADDTLLEVNVTANRPDWAGVFGIARDLAAAGAGKLKPIAAEARPGALKSPVGVRSELSGADTVACPYFIGRYVRGVRNGSSPDWMQARLVAAGARPINTLVDITNYLCFGFCRPLHVFDADKLKGDLRVRLSKAKEKFVGLDGKEYELGAGLTVIADDAGVLAAAGVLGGERSGCTPTTKNVLLEVAYFDPSRTATAGRQLQINSASRYRFERGVDRGFLEKATDIASQYIVELCGGELAEAQSFGAVPPPYDTVTYKPTEVARIAGFDVAAAKQKQILTALGFTISDQGAAWQVTPPSWRGDIQGARDFVEEVLRIVGFDAVPMGQVMPTRALSGKAGLTKLQISQFAAQRALAVNGFLGCVTWSFMSSALAQQFAPNQSRLHISNPIASDLDYLRPSLLPNLILAAARNHARSNPQVSLSEVGPIFSARGEEVAQTLFAAGVRSGAAQTRHWLSGKARDVDCFDVKADLYALLEMLSIPAEKLTIVKEAPEYYHPGLSGAVVLIGEGKPFGYFGMLHPKLLAHLKYDQPIAAFEVNLELLPTQTDTTRPKLVLNDSQPVERDFAFLLPVEFTAAQLQTIAVEAVNQEADSIASTETTVFDVYRGKGIPEGMRSVALSVRLQPKQGVTLQQDQIQAIGARIVARIIKITGGQQR